MFVHSLMLMCVFNWIFFHLIYRRNYFTADGKDILRAAAMSLQLENNVVQLPDDDVQLPEDDVQLPEDDVQLPEDESDVAPSDDEDEEYS